MKIKHIIFDMDGTLSDTAKATYAATTEGAKVYGFPHVDYMEILAAMGLPGLDFYSRLYPGVSAAELLTIEKQIDDGEECMVKSLGAEILFPGVFEMLEALIKDGYSLYIASTGSTRHVHATLQASGIEKYFTGIHSNRPEKVSMVKEIIAGRDVSEWVMVGDMFKDSDAARGNGIVALGAGFGYLAKEDEGLFDYVLKTPMDIFKILKAE